MMKKLLILLTVAGFLSACTNKPTTEEVYTKEMLERLNTALVEILSSNMSQMEEQASHRGVSRPYYKTAKGFKDRCEEIIGVDSVIDFKAFAATYTTAMDSIADIANSNKFNFFMQNVEPVTELLPKSDVKSRGNRSLLIAKMRNDVLVNTVAVTRFYQYEMSYDNIFGSGEEKHELEIDTTGLAATKTFKLKLEGLRYRDTLAVTRDMITITENGKDITDQVEFEIYDYDPDVVGIVEMNTTEPGDYEFSGTFDIYFQRKEFVLHQPFNFKFTIK